MMAVSGELYRAAAGLRKAAEAEFMGNAYYQAANQAALLIEIIGPAKEGAAPSSDAAQGFAAVLAEVRNGIQSELSGNRYYLAINKLEELASFANQAAQMPAQRGPAFAELAAASTARVEAAAANLGIMMARKAAPPLTAGTSTDGELERRSSEPCLMAQLATPAREPVAHDTKAASAGQTVAAAAGAGPDAPGRAAGQKIQPKEPEENRPKEPKTLFKLWLDLAFGRKD